jgi:hypothetical protein
MSYRQKMGYTPTARDMKGGKLMIEVNRKTGATKVDMDNVLGIKGAMKDIVGAVTNRNMSGSGPKARPMAKGPAVKPKKKK